MIKLGKNVYLCSVKCSVCPRGCEADRIERYGFCHAGREPVAASVCAHRGEEPPLSGERGICNVFFSHCNLRCVYCQNHAVSRGLPAADNAPAYHGVEAIVERIVEVLGETENMVGFVTPSHYADAIPAIVEALHAHGLHPVTVYNTGGYDSVETLRRLEPYIDIYLPDYKYADVTLAERYSHAPDYPSIAQAALEEMYRQKGSGLPTDERGLAYRGIIVRHLVLPGQTDNTLAVLDSIADVSMNLHVSLMAQYYPPRTGLPDELGRTLTPEEYALAVERLQALGLCRGWVQELDAQACYRPDFTRREAFEKTC